MRKAALIGCFLAAVSFAARCYADPSQAEATACANTRDDLKRLECFDRLFPGNTDLPKANGATDPDGDELDKIPCPSLCTTQQIGSWKFNSGFPLWLKGEPRPDRSWRIGVSNARSETLDIACQHGIFTLDATSEGSSVPQQHQVPFSIIVDRGRFRFAAWGERQDDIIASLRLRLLPMQMAILRSANYSIMLEFLDRTPPLIFPAIGTASALATLNNACR